MIGAGLGPFMLCRTCPGCGQAAQDREDSQQEEEDLIKSDCNMIDPDRRGNIPFVSHGGRRNVMHVPPASVWRIVYDRRAEKNLKR